MLAVVLRRSRTARPVVVSDLPSHRELASAYPGWVHVVKSTGGRAERARRA